MERSRFFIVVVSLLLLSTPEIAYTDNQLESSGLVAPKGLNPCAPNDPVATLETRFAASIGSQFLNCFLSEKRVAVPGANELATIPLEYAFAIRIAGDSYASADLDKLQATVTGQWKNFQPLSKEFHENYIALLNALIKRSGESSTTLSSIKPVLVSIERLNINSYSVVSIRSYVFNARGAQVSITKVNADAVVLRGRDLIRLTMQRVLTGVSDVAQLQTEISDWALATEEVSP